MEDLNDMLIFAEVARGGSLTRAGLTLGMPKATVSRRLARLEQRMGLRLVDKTTRRLELTEAGQAFYERCLPILENVEEARDFASQLTSRPHGRLRVSAPADLATQWLAEPLATFCRNYPEITIELDLSSRHVDLVGERVDVAIRAGRLEDSGMVTRTLCEMTQSLYASPQYLREAGLPTTPEDLASHRFVLLQGASKLRRIETLSRGKQQISVTMHGSLQANSVAMLRELAIVHCGIAALPDAMTAGDIASGRLTRILADWSMRSDPVQLVMPSRRFTPRKTQVFVEHMLKMLPGYGHPMPEIAPTPLA
ncbi:MAG: LysR family transcriptional regulator [Janthinobacterium lividum]